MTRELLIKEIEDWIKSNTVPLKRSEIQINDFGGKPLGTVQGYVSGVLGIHKIADGAKNNPLWNISHLPTGGAMRTGFNQSGARRFLYPIVNLWDWDFTDKENPTIGKSSEVVLPLGRYCLGQELDDVVLQKIVDRINEVKSGKAVIEKPALKPLAIGRSLL